jgi:EAL domain-containing protein (putative c-di-GMP-specific phosphodiesterase class I)/ActR/RegA family two-component response regulator
MSQQNRILIVDDEADMRAYFRDIAEEMGYLVEECGDYETFAAVYSEFGPTVILLDLSMPGRDGIEFLRELDKRKCSAPILLTSGQDERVLATAQRLGEMLSLSMRGVLQKPVSVIDLETALEEVGVQSAGLSPVALKNAIENDELVLYYQPKVDLRYGDEFPIIGAEALVRWNHPTRGMVPPDLFIPMAEETALIGPLTDVTMRLAAKRMQEWAHCGIDLPVAVNLSPTQLTELTLPDRIASLLKEFDVNPSRLVVEVTEQAAMADVGKATDILTRLRLKSIEVSLDDFGAGYSSLVEIYRMPLSELKFDRSLMVDLDRDAGARTVVKALMALTKELKLPVCAEGVETAQTARLLQSIGCETAQGFYFARPMPAHEFADFVKAKRVVRSHLGDRPAVR